MVAVFCVHLRCGSVVVRDTHKECYKNEADSYRAPQSKALLVAHTATPTNRFGTRNACCMVSKGVS